MCAVRTAIDQKALDVRILNLEGLTDIADYFVVASGTSDRHVRSIADKISRAMTDLGERTVSARGPDSKEWVLLDYGDVVVHVFYEPARQYYEFDELWSRARAIPLESKLESEARKLRTGLIRD